MFNSSYNGFDYEGFTGAAGDAGMMIIIAFAAAAMLVPALMSLVYVLRTRRTYAFVAPLIRLRTTTRGQETTYEPAEGERDRAA